MDIMTEEQVSQDARDIVDRLHAVHQTDCRKLVLNETTSGRAALTPQPKFVNGSITFYKNYRNNRNIQYFVIVLILCYC